MNKIKLDLSNFQSISSGHLEFKTGLNFIIGQSNSGKSATFRALKACLTNPSGSQRFIKSGEKAAQVTLSYNGNKISWKRNSREGSYEINDEKYVKTGKSDAFKIIDDTGFVRDHNETLMNIEEELQLPFPFGFSKSDLFKLFEDIFCVSDSAIVLKSIKDQEREVRGEISLLENDMEKVKRKINALNEFKSDVDIQELKRIKTSLTIREDELKKLKEGMDVINIAIDVSNIELPSIVEFKSKLTDYDNLNECKKSMNNLKAIHKLSQEISTTKITKYPSIIEYEEKRKVQQTVSTLKELLKIDTNSSFSSPSINLNEYNELRKMSKEIKVLQELLKVELPSYSISNKLQDYEQLKKYKEDLQRIITQGKRASERKKELVETIKGIQEKLKQFKVCPLCHQPLKEGDN